MPALRANDFRAPPPAAEDEPELARLPPPYAAILRQANGWLWLRGGFHVRGACRALPWHSIAEVWTGDLALSTLFPEVRPDDAPIAQDAFGDQYLLRGDEVIHLKAESGSVAPLGVDVRTSFTRVRNDGASYLNLGAFLATCEAEGDLAPGQLVSVYPPFVVDAASRSFRRIPSSDRLGYLSTLSQGLADVPDGAKVVIRTKS